MHTRKPEVGKKLLEMNRFQLLDRFQFQDNQLINDQVHLECDVKSKSLVNERNWYLMASCKVALL